MHKVACKVIGALLVLFIALTSTAKAYTCHVTQTLSGYSTEDGTCTWHCSDGDHAVPNCGFYYEYMFKTCTNTTQFCPVQCTLIQWRDYTYTHCLCNYLAGCDPDTWWYGEIETCDVCGGS